jgi:hypothetical protein
MSNPRSKPLYPGEYRYHIPQKASAVVGWPSATVSKTGGAFGGRAKRNRATR